MCRHDGAAIKARQGDQASEASIFRTVIPVQIPFAESSSINSMIVRRTASVAELTGKVLDQQRLAGRVMAGSTIRRISGRLPEGRNARAEAGSMVQALPDCAMDSNVGRESI